MVSQYIPHNLNDFIKSFELSDKNLDYRIEKNAQYVSLTLKWYLPKKDKSQNLPERTFEEKEIQSNDCENGLLVKNQETLTEENCLSENESTVSVSSLDSGQEDTNSNHSFIYKHCRKKKNKSNFNSALIDVFSDSEGFTTPTNSETEAKITSQQSTLPEYSSYHTYKTNLRTQNECNDSLENQNMLTINHHQSIDNNMAINSTSFDKIGICEGNISNGFVNRNERNLLTPIQEIMTSTDAENLTPKNLNTSKNFQFDSLSNTGNLAENNQSPPSKKEIISDILTTKVFIPCQLQKEDDNSKIDKLIKESKKDDRKENTATTSVTEQHVSKASLFLNMESPSPTNTRHVKKKVEKYDSEQSDDSPNHSDSAENKKVKNDKMSKKVDHFTFETLTKEELQSLYKEKMKDLLVVRATKYRLSQTQLYNTIINSQIIKLDNILDVYYDEEIMTRPCYLIQVKNQKVEYESGTLNIDGEEIKVTKPTPQFFQKEMRQEYFPDQL